MSVVRPPDHGKESKTAVAWSRLTFIRSGQNYFARHSEGGKKTKQTEEEVTRQHQGMDRPGVRQIPEGSGEHGKLINNQTCIGVKYTLRQLKRYMEETGCEIICGAPTTLAVK